MLSSLCFLALLASRNPFDLVRDRLRLPRVPSVSAGRPPSRRGGILFAVLPLCGIASMADPVLRSAITSHVSPDEQGLVQVRIEMLSNGKRYHVHSGSLLSHKGGLASLVTVGGTVGPLLAGALLSSGTTGEEVS